jgi:hypothetical protein
VFEQLTPLVNVFVTLLAVALPPYITGLVPVNEQNPFSTAHCVYSPDEGGVDVLPDAAYQQLFA